MEHKMLWGSLAAGCAGWLCLLLLASRGTPNLVRENKSPLIEGLSFAIPLLVWLATLPAKAPFSSGQGWGRGFLLGGLLSAITCFVAFRTSRATTNSRYFALASIFAALIIVCVPLLWMRNAAIEVLLGAGLGWAVVALTWLCAPAPKNQPLPQITSSPMALGLFNGATFVTALCSVVAVAFYRDFVVTDVPRGTHPAIAVVIAASIGLALLVGVLLNEASRGESALARPFQLITTLLCFIVPLGIGYFLSTRVLDDLKLFYCLAIGAVLGLLGWALLWNHNPSNEHPPSTASISPVASVAALSAFMLAYSFLQGFGVGLMLLAAWPITLLLWPSVSETQPDQWRLGIAQTASLLGSSLAVLLVSRVFATRFRADLRGINLVDQFALFGFLAGAIMPSLLSSLWFNTRETRSNSIASLLQFMGIGILTLLLPSAILAIWGIKVMPAFFAGMALSLIGWNTRAEVSARTSALAVFALALSLAITQWTLRFLPLAELSRSQRLHFLLWGLGGSVVLILVVDLVARLLLHFQNRANQPTQGVSQ